MAQIAYAAQIDLGFGNTPREFLHFRRGVRSGNLPRAGGHFL
jgi:hypothetical protein